MLYCIHFLLSTQQNHYFALLKRAIKHISHVCGLISPTNVISRRSPTFAARIFGDNQHPLHEGLSKARSHPPPGAVLSCYPPRLLHIGTLSFQRYHDFWLTETQNWTITYKICLDVYPLTPSLTVPPEIHRRRSWKFYFLSFIKHYSYLLLNKLSNRL